MNRTRPRLAYCCVVSVITIVAAAGMASANYMELLRRVPDSANTLIMIDVERHVDEPDRHEGEVA